MIPTYILPPQNLTGDEKIVYEAIRDRFLANFMPPAEYENTEIITGVDKYKFYTKGKVLVVKGFLEIYNKESKASLLPRVEKGDSVDVVDIVPEEKTTTPPKSYTEDTLLKAMKNCGKNVPDDDTSVLSGYSIGTSATRADVLKKIKQVGYVNKKGKSYYITDLGINLVEIFPVKNLFDVDFTGKLEKNLLDIQKGAFSRKDYLNMVCAFIYESVNEIKHGQARPINTDKIVYNPKTKKYVKESQLKKYGSKAPKAASKTKIDPDTGLEIISSCPECGGDIIESDKAFACKNYKNCGFTLWKNDSLLAKYKKKPNKTMVKSISKSKKAKVKGMVGPDGNK
ncbi:MAG: DNA topoisomerase, partial [Peptostreptococcus anaerobius]